MEAWQIISKIAEMRSYIASDWPSKEERARLYRAIAEMEILLAGKKDEAANDEHKKT